MPKKINTRISNNTSLSKLNINTNTGNVRGNNIYFEVINSVNNLTKTELLKKFNNDYEYNYSIKEKALLNYTGVVVNDKINYDNIVVQNMELNNNETYDYLRPIPEKYLNNIYYDFILQYLNISPLEIGSVKQYNEIINVIEYTLNTHVVTSYNQIILLIYRDALNCLFKARKEYVNLLAVTNEIKFIKKKYDKLNLLNIDILGELKKFAGNNGITTTNVACLKPPIYMQALFDIYMAWYQYIYKTTKIDYNLYKPIKNFVNSLGGRKQAYNTLINLLDKSEMYTGYFEINYKYDSYKINNNAMIKVSEDLSSNSSIFATINDMESLINDKSLLKLREHFKNKYNYNNILDLKGKSFLKTNDIGVCDVEFTNIVPDVYSISRNIIELSNNDI